jgi:hypothetical protein
MLYKHTGELQPIRRRLRHFCRESRSCLSAEDGTSQVQLLTLRSTPRNRPRWQLKFPIAFLYTKRPKPAGRGEITRAIRKPYAWADEFKPGGKSMANIFQGHFPDKSRPENAVTRSVAAARAKSAPVLNHLGFRCVRDAQRSGGNRLLGNR